MQFLLALLLQFFLAPQESVVELSPSNTKIEFSGKHFGVINVKGHFSQFEGKLTFDNGTLKTASMQIEVESITTGNNGRDKSLKNDTFLDAIGHPYIVFKSNRKVTAESFEGTLRIKNNSNVVSISYTQEDENGVRLLKGECLLKRTDFNLEFGSMNDLVSNEIKVFLEVTLPNR